MTSVGIDLGKRKSSVAFVQDGEVRERRTVRSVASLERDIGPQRASVRVAIEAGRGAWAAYDLLTSWGNEVVLVDTTRVRQLGIGRHGKKTDRIDADILALAVDEGRIPTAHVLSTTARQIREQLAVRNELINQRRRLVTQIRGLMQGRGTIAPSCAAHDFARLMQQAQLEGETISLVAPLVKQLAPVEEQIAVVEEKLHAIAEQMPVTQQLATVPGVALVVALAFVAVIDTPHRFRHASKVAAYLGLVPNERSSGGKRKLGAITKQGNGYLRSLLVQSAWSIMRARSKDDPLVLWAQRLTSRRGKHIAVVAVARRLARLMWSMWRHGDVYDSIRLSEEGARGHSKRAQDEQRHAAVLLAGATKLRKQQKASARRGANARERIQREQEAKMT